MIEHAKLTAWVASRYDDLKDTATCQKRFSCAVSRILSAQTDDAKDEKAALGPLTPARMNWAWNTLRAIVPREAVLVAEPLFVPVVSYNFHSKTGEIANLVLEVLEGAWTEDFDQPQGLHPCDRFITLGRAVEDFARESIQPAWDIAYRMSVPQPCEGRWRLLDENNAPIVTPFGGSAGGAAAVGWLRLLKKQVYHPSMIIMGALENDQEKLTLRSIEHLDEKLQAIIDRHTRFDTIVVAAADLAKVVEYFKRSDFRQEVQRLDKIFFNRDDGAVFLVRTA